MVPKLTIMFDAFMFYMALADRARAWRAERDAAGRRELGALRAEQEATARLHRAERERLEALVLAQAKSQQLAMASHDIRQPLASLRLSLERLMAGVSSAPGATSGVRQSLDYLQKLADEYSEDQDPAEVASRKTPVEPARASFGVATLFHNIDLMFRDEAEAKGLVFRCRSCEADVQGDAMAAMRLVSNLVANAVKYTEQGKVLVGCRRRVDGITIVVADTGPGIPAGEIARVLRERERGAAAHDKEGRGLGLAIVTTLAERNGYGFDCRSRVGRGTAFFVDLPRVGRLAETAVGR
jgi:signal transduction histidine kinase